MKRPEINKQYMTIAIYAFGVALLSTLFGLIVFNLADIAAFFGNAISAIKAVPYGIVIALVLYPFVNLVSPLYSRLLEKKRPRPRLVSALSLLTVYLGLFLVLAILLLSIIPPMITTVGELVALLQGALASAEGSLRALFAEDGSLAGMADTVIAYIKEAAQGIFGSDLAGTATTLVTTIIGETFNILIGLIISIYLLAGRTLLGSVSGKMVAALLPQGGAHRFTMFIKRLYSNFTEFISARIISALFLGVLSYLLFLISGVPFYPLLSLIIVVFNLFPVFGTIFSLLLCATVLLITRPQYALLVIAILIVLEIVDNLLVEPRTMPHKALRPNVGTTIVLMLIGFALLGVGGALIAIPVFATIQNAMRAFTIHLLNRRHLPTVLEEYQTINIRDYMRDGEGEGAEGATDPETAEAVGTTETAEGAE